MNDLRTAAQQALEALESVYGDSCDALHALRAALAQQPNPPGCDHCNHPLYAATKCRVCGRVTEQAEPVEPVAWLTPRNVDSYSRPDLGYETSSKTDYGAFPVYTAPPRCPNCASLERQNTELDRKLAELEQAEPVQEPPRAYYTIDEINAKFAPLQRKPLTEEEIERICMTYQSPRQAVRAIERAHGITGDNTGDNT